MADSTILVNAPSSLSPNVSFSQSLQPKMGSEALAESKVPDLREAGYNCIRYMGTCSGGHIYLGREQNMSKSFVAIKKYSIDDIDDYTDIAKDTANLRLLKHDNILHLIQSFVFERSIYQITPAMNLGSLSDIVIEYKKWGINEKATAAIVHQVLEALIYLHQRRYIHRDVKSKHILIDSSGHVKLSGFRFMVELNQHLDSVFDYGSHLHNQIYYLAPEVLIQNMSGYTTKSDIYMLGITICEAINGVMPFSELAPMEMLLRKMNGQVPRPVDRVSLDDDQQRGINIAISEQRPQDHIAREFSAEMHEFVSNCLAYDQGERWSATDLKKSKWLQLDQHKNLVPSDVSKELQLEYGHFDLSLWPQEPMMTPEPEHRYPISFDYSALS